MHRIIVCMLMLPAIFSLVSCSPQGQGKSVATKTEEAGAIDVNNQYCPVTGEKIQDGSAVTYVYEGKIYHFCCAGCIASFRKDPQKYIQKMEGGKAHPESQEQMH